MSATPTLAVFSYNYAPELTGIAYYNRAMAVWIQQHSGWQAQVFTGIPHYPWWQVPEDYRNRSFRGGRGDEVLEGVAVVRAPHYIPSMPVTGRQRMQLDASWLASIAWRCLRVRRRPTAILMIAPPFLSGVLGRILGWWWRCPVVYHVQDLQVDAAIDLGVLPGRLAGLLQGVERWILRHIDIVSTVSGGMRRRLRSKVRRPVWLFRNWADPADMRLRDPAWIQAYRSRWQVADGDAVVMYSGNMGLKQGLDDLVAALEVLADDEGIHAVLAGHGAAREVVEDLVTQAGLTQVQFEDLQPFERLSAFLCAADMHVIPQKRAVGDLVMPSKLLNIMAVGRPVVVAAEPDTELAQVVRAADCGVVVPPEDPAALAAGIRELVADPDRRRRCGTNGKGFLHRHLTAEVVVGGFMDRLVRQLNRRRCCSRG